jgi:hypothetical protein
MLACIYPPRSACLMSCNIYFLMSERPTLCFSVAKFAIEGDGEGMKCTQPVYSIPPCLSGSQMLSSAESPLFDHFSVLNVPASDSSNSRRMPQNICTNACHVPSVSPLLSLPKVVSPFLNVFSIALHNPSPIISSNITTNTRSDSPIPRHCKFVQKHFAQVPSSGPTPPSMHIPSSTSAPASSSPNTAGNTFLMSTRKPRRALTDRAILQSPYRPHVSAADRIFSWRTPYGMSHDHLLSADLPPALVESAKMSITGALAASTRSTYASGILRFNQFCDKWHISEGARMPASYGLLCAFIGEYKGTISSKTIRSWLSGIRAWHLANHAQWSGDDKWVQMARTSANKEGAHHKCPLRAPVSIEHLLALRRVISPSDPFHASVWAAALITFFGCRRLGETTVPSSSAFDIRYHIVRSTA